MPRFVIKLTDKKKNKNYYLLWSTIVDGATRQFKNKKDAYQYLEETLVPLDFKNSVKLLDKGTSTPFYSLQDVLDCNDEDCSTVQEMIKKYVKERNL